MRKLFPWVLAGLLGLGLLYEMTDRRLDQTALDREAQCARIAASYPAPEKPKAGTWG